MRVSWRLIAVASAAAVWMAPTGCSLDTAGLFTNSTSSSSTSGGGHGGGSTTSSSSSAGSGGASTTSSTSSSSTSSSSSGGQGGAGGTTTTSTSSSSSSSGGTGGTGGGPPDACGMNGTVVFDPTMSCYKEGLYRAGNFLPVPDSSPNTPVCQTGACANTPMAGDIDVLWVKETTNDGKFTSVNVPVSYRYRCPPFNAANPPTLDQLKVEHQSASGWYNNPGVTVNGTSYKLTGANCFGGSVMYEVHY